MRGALAALFVLLGALLTFPATAAVWEQRVLTDQEAFISLGQDVLEDSAVQDRLTERITEDTITVAAANGIAFPNNALGNFARAQTEALTHNLVRELPTSPIGEQALITAHKAVLAFIDDDNDRLESSGDEIRVNFRPIVEQVTDTVEQLLPGSPELVIPAGIGEFVIIREHDTALAFRAARLFDGLAWYIAALPLIAYLIALVVASNRQITLFLIGLSAIIAAGLRILVIEGPLRTTITSNAVDDASLRPAALGVYDAVAASFVAQDMVLFVAGIFVVVASIVWWAIKRTGNF